MAGKEHARRVLVLEHRRLLLGLNEVTLAPSRFHGWRRQAISIRYSDIVAIENVAPEPGKRAALTLRLGDGEVIAVAYPRRSELRMRSIRHHCRSVCAPLAKPVRRPRPQPLHLGLERRSPTPSSRGLAEEVPSYAAEWSCR
jgi:hypothetical protein